MTGDLKVSAGNAVLVFTGDKEKAAKELKAFDHGNIDFQIEFMLAPGAEAALLFQGIYLVHVNDSWGEKNINYKDCGGISISNDISLAANNVKRVPLSNSCRAPGYGKNWNLVLRHLYLIPAAKR
jgi:hypothetical protein